MLLSIIDGTAKQKINKEIEGRRRYHMERRQMRLMKHHFRKGRQKGFKKQHDTRHKAV